MLFWMKLKCRRAKHVLGGTAEFVMPLPIRIFSKVRQSLGVTIDN
jgi:hypothetical protein